MASFKGAAPGYAATVSKGQFLPFYIQLKPGSLSQGRQDSQTVFRRSQLSKARVGDHRTVVRPFDAFGTPRQRKDLTAARQSVSRFRRKRHPYRCGLSCMNANAFHLSEILYHMHHTGASLACHREPRFSTTPVDVSIRQWAPRGIRPGSRPRAKIS